MSIFDDDMRIWLEKEENKEKIYDTVQKIFIKNFDNMFKYTYDPDLECKCGHVAKFHRKDIDDRIFFSFNLADCIKCECKKFMEKEDKQKIKVMLEL